jgi:putative DNA primase/helicase
LAALLIENQRWLPPLDNDDVERIARSIGKRPSKSNAATQGDLAERVMTIVLDRYFGGGDRLIFAKDGQFWMHNGKFWEPAQSNWLSGRTFEAIQDMSERGGKATSAIVGQVASLLKAKLAVNDDPLRFMGSPLPVLNCSNGELWIDSEGAVELRPHLVKSYLRHCLDVAYDPDATCPLYDAAVKEIFSRASPTAKGMVRHWHEFVGYLMQSRRDIPLVTILKGGGSNGKTVLMETVTKLIGENQVSAQRIESLENQFAMGNLLQKLLLLDDDVRSGVRLPDGQLKKISEEKMVTGERKHGAQFNFIARALPVLLCNNVPSLADVSKGMRRRLMVVPFDRTFSEQEIDTDLFKRIWEQEMPGILNRSLEGLQRLLKRGMKFRPPVAITAAKDTWLAEANPLPAFLSECCERDPDASYLLSDFYLAYTIWAQKKGYTRTQQSASIARNLEHFGFLLKKRNRGQTIIGLKAI